MINTSYFTPDGRMTLVPGQECDNGILFLSTYCVLIALQGGAVQLSLLRYSDTIHGCEAQPGLYHRAPGRVKDTQAPDDYVGIAAVSVFLHLNFPIDMVSYGIKNGFNYDNTHPGGFSFTLWRQGGDIAFYSICAEYRPELVQFIWLCAGMVVTAFLGEKHASEHLQTWLRVSAIEKQGLELWARPWFAISALIWRIGVAIRFGNLARVFEIYYPEGHPNLKLAQEIYGKRQEK